MNPTTAAAQPMRIASIDLLRAFTMLGMIFVNDLWSLKDIPAWLEHVSADADGMGLADIVFPGFLFIVGMSIPFAIRNRQSKGENIRQVSLHILTRGLALLVMGLFLVNGEYLNAEKTGMSRGAWNVLSCSAFILLWNQYPKSWPVWLKKALQAVGIVVLGLLAYAYRGGEGEEVKGFSTWWWGILGLIGWAYLVAALLFTWTTGKLLPLLAGWIISMGLSAAHHMGMLPEQGLLNVLLSPIEKGAMTALTIGGALASQVFWSQRKNPAYFNRLVMYFGLAAFLLLALGFASRPLWGISKIRATPSWVLICSSIMLLAFILVTWVADIRQKASWFKLIGPAGSDTLLCYLVPYYAYAAVAVISWSLPAFLLTGVVGLLKSLVFALLVILLAGVLSKRGLRLKL